MNTNKHNKVLQYVVRTVLLIAFVLGTGSSCFAHTDRIDQKVYGNVSVSITTGFRYEEINQTFMLGNYAQLLSEELNYQGHINIHYDHVYVESRQPEYYISRGNTMRITNNSNSIGKTVTDKESLFIWIYASNLNFTETIKMIEFAILNSNKIEAKQVLYHINKDYSYWKNDVIAYPLDELVKVKEKKLSKTAGRVLSQKVVRPEKNQDLTSRSDIKYYCINDSMHIIAKPNTSLSIYPDSILLLSIPDVYWFEELPGGRSALIFDTDTSFYYAEVDNQLRVSISKRKVINNRQYKYYPFECKKVGTDKIFITFTVPDNRILDARDIKAIQERVFDRTVLYDTKNDRLIQDYDRFMKGTQ